MDADPGAPTMDAEGGASRAAGQRPRLVLLTADTVGGVWSYAVELAGGLSRRGVRVAIAAMGAPLDAERRRQALALPGVSLHESAFALEWMREPWDDVARAGDWLLMLEHARRPDVVHLNQFAFGALPFRAPRLVVAHSCVCTWWRAVLGERAPASWDRYRAVVRAGLRGASLVAAPTRAMLHALRAEHAFDGDAVVLPNGRDAARFAPGPKEPFVLSAGRLWDDAKNLAALDAAAPGLPWPVRVAGAAAHPEGGDQPTRHVELLGPLAPGAMATWMARASIFALPARYEPFGLSALEAGLAGCALVLGDVPSLHELWDGAATFVAPHDIGALREVLGALARDEERRAALAAAARRRALTYSTERMTDAYLDAYARLSRKARLDHQAGAVRPASAPEGLSCAS